MNKQEKIKYYKVIKKALLRLNSSIFNNLELKSTIKKDDGFLITDKILDSHIIQGVYVAHDILYVKKIADLTGFVNIQRLEVDVAIDTEGEATVIFQTLHTFYGYVGEKNTGMYTREYRTQNKTWTAWKEVTVKTSSTAEGSVFNLTSTTPSGMLEADVQTLIDQKIATKVATIPPNTTTVYKYTPKPFFAGLVQPPVTANLPIGTSVVMPYNSATGYSYNRVETTPIVAIAEGKVFSAQLLHRSSSNYETVLSSWKIDDNGSLSNQKYEIQYGYSDSSRYPTAMVASADSSFIVIAMSNKKVRTIVYNKVTARYELANEFTVTYNISNLHLTGDSSELLITFNHDTQIGKSYKAQGGSWVEYTSIDSYKSLEDSILSKDGKKFIAFINQYDGGTPIKVVNRTNLSSSLDVPNSSNSDIHGYTDSMHVGKLRISGDGKVLYVGSNNTIKTYSINEDNTFTLLEEAYSGSSMFAKSYDVSLDGRTIATVSEDGTGVTVYRKES